MRIRKNKEKRKYSWDGLTVGQLMRIREISKESISDEEKDFKVGALVNGIDYNEFITLPLSKTEGLMRNVSFLYTEPKAVKARRVYEVNGRKYRLHRDTVELTVAQYIDFQAISDEGFERMMPEMLAIFLIPVGHQYNDGGYDSDEVLNDMRDLSVTEALGIADFFTRKYARLTLRTLTFSEAAVKAQRIMAKKEEKEMMRAIELETKLMADELRSLYGSLLSRR